MVKDIGAAGENIFHARARRLGYEVEWLTNRAEFWDKDCDFLVFNPLTGARRLIEVKTDSRLYDTGNLYIETENKNSKDARGWYCFCAADIIAYCDYSAPRKPFYLFSLEELRAHVEEKEWPCATCGADSRGILFPLSEIQKFSSFRTI